MQKIPLSRRQHGIDVHDTEATRAWLQGLVWAEIRRQGRPRPRILLLGDTHEDTVLLDDMAARDAAAHIGATFRQLRGRTGVERCFLITTVQGRDHADEPSAAALLVEITPGEAPPQYWFSVLFYSTDPESGVGVPSPRWSTGEARAFNQLPAFIQELLYEMPGSRAAALGVPRSAQPDIKTAFGELPPGERAPRTAGELADLAGSMAAAELLQSGLRGTIVLRFHGRDWEWWVLGEGQPAGLDDMVRYICHREPAADGVAIVLLALFEGASPPQPGIQVVAEHRAGRAERFALLDFPQGPGGPRRISRILGRELHPPGEDEGWLDVEPMVLFDLTPVGGLEV